MMIEMIDLIIDEKVKMINMIDILGFKEHSITLNWAIYDDFCLNRWKMIESIISSSKKTFDHFLSNNALKSFISDLIKLNSS
jgi:hypothetical protein